MKNFTFYSLLLVFALALGFTQNAQACTIDSVKVDSYECDTENFGVFTVNYRVYYTLDALDYEGVPGNWTYSGNITTQFGLDPAQTPVTHSQSGATVTPYSSSEVIEVRGTVAGIFNGGEFFLVRDDNGPSCSRISISFNLFDVPCNNCGTTFVDDGGSNNDYNPASATPPIVETYQGYLICPNTTFADTMITLDFSPYAFDINPASLLGVQGDILTIYDGLDIFAPVLGSYDGTDNPGTLTATNSSGCLYARFYVNTDADVGAGWEADITCAKRVASGCLIDSIVRGDIECSATDFGAFNIDYRVHYKIPGEEFLRTSADGVTPATWVYDATLSTQLGLANETANINHTASTADENTLPDTVTAFQDITIPGTIGGALTGVEVFISPTDGQSSSTASSCGRIGIAIDLSDFPCNDCGKVFRDDAGTDNYEGAGVNRYLICPNTLNNDTSAALTFTEFDLQTGLLDDVLTIYDGLDASAPVLGAYTGNTLPEGGATIVASNNFGCLYVTFNGYDIFADAPGWTAGITCVAQPDCSIDSIVPIGDGSCEQSSFLQTMKVCYKNAPQTGTLVVNNFAFEFDKSGGVDELVCDTFSVRFNALGETITTVGAGFSDNSSCSRLQAGLDFGADCGGCGFVFSDDGGYDASANPRTGSAEEFNYANFQYSTYLICPDQAFSGDAVTLTFTDFELEEAVAGICPDDMAIYDGIDITASPLFTDLCGTDLPNGGQPITATNSSGCLAVRFYSSATNIFRGWEANITCSAKCNADAGEF